MTAAADTLFAYRRSPDQDRAQPAHHPVVIVGAGPVGLVLALDLASKGHRCVVLDRRQGPSEGSRAICWSKRTLEIMGRLSLADDLIRRGVTWKTGKVFNGTREVYSFDLQPESGHQRPAFINLQQFHFETHCVTAAAYTGLIDLRWGHEVTAVVPSATGASLQISTRDGAYTLTADWLVAADGVQSIVRRELGLGFEGRTFNDQFLICDVKLLIDRPTERWFWFDPPFNPGQSALLHRQADNVWRLDFQIGADADRDEEMRPENVARRVSAMLGDIDFTFEWISCYRFHCRRLARFRHGRILFAGDAAHQVSPFGARGGNSGIQDADNLAWKLDLVLRKRAPETLVDSYDIERRQAADENILASSRATDFISPKGAGARAFRDAVLGLVETEPFARPFLNSGRLSVPTTYEGSPLSSFDGFAPHDTQALRPGAAAVDAPVGNGWLLAALGGDFCQVSFARNSGNAPHDANGTTGVRHVIVTDETACKRYGAADLPATYLIRPDQHVAARWRHAQPEDIAAAYRSATAA
ncbi:MAG TPA: FAD-dependent oxidoreductase [Hyphomicrobiaceae bacterium]